MQGNVNQPLDFAEIYGLFVLLLAVVGEHGPGSYLLLQLSPGPVKVAQSLLHMLRGCIGGACGAMRMRSYQLTPPKWMLSMHVVAAVHVNLALHVPPCCTLSSPCHSMKSSDAFSVLAAIAFVWTILERLAVWYGRRNPAVVKHVRSIMRRMWFKERHHKHITPSRRSGCAPCNLGHTASYVIFLRWSSLWPSNIKLTVAGMRRLQVFGHDSHRCPACAQHLRHWPQWIPGQRAREPQVQWPAPDPRPTLLRIAWLPSTRPN